MSAMNISLKLTGEELALLADMVWVAMVVAEEAGEQSPLLFRQWKKLSDSILKSAQQLPDGDQHVNYIPEERSFSLAEDYVNTSFPGDILNEYRDSLFWEELVTRMADMLIVRNVGMEQFERMNEDERRAMTASYEKQLWQECTQHGLERFKFILPPNEI